MASKIWLTVSEAAHYVSVSIDTIYDACLAGDLRHSRIGGRRLIRIHVEWLDSWLDRHSQSVDGKPPRSEARE